MYSTNMDGATMCKLLEKAQSHMNPVERT